MDIFFTTHLNFNLNEQLTFSRVWEFSHGEEKHLLAYY